MDRRSTPDRHDERPDLTEKLNVNGKVFRLTEKEKSYRHATKHQHTFIPPSDGTPVNNLPNELLSYIFTLGSEAETRGYGDDDSEEDVAGKQRPHLQFQVLASHVCRQWRAVAVETPTLWTYLDFEEGLPFGKSRTWLERSKECPLDIVLDCTVDSEPEPESESESESESDGSEDQTDSPTDDELVAPWDRFAMSDSPLGDKENKKLRSYISPADLPVVRDLILPHYARWRVFDFMVDDFQLMYDMLSTLASIPEAPALRALLLYLCDGDEDYDYFNPVYLKEPFFAPFCGRAPELRLVKLWGVHVNWETCVFLQGLEELALEYHPKDVRPPYEVFARILQGSPNLHTLTLSESGPAGHPEENWPADVIELRSVRQLGLIFAEPSYASALLKRLVFPNLLDLSLQSDPEEPKDCTAFVEQLASPPSGQLHSVCHNLVELKLSGMQCSDTTPATLYAALPNLISLNINCYHLQHQFFTCLFTMQDLEEPDYHYYLPKLTTLTTSGISIVRMCSLVNMRRTIKHVRMDSKTDVDKENEAWLRAHTESFEIFDGSDLSAESDAESDGVPEWIDDDDVISLLVSLLQYEH